jgi:hypothetical protein
MKRLITLAGLLVVAAPIVAAPNLPDREDSAVRAVVEGLFKDAAAGDWAGYAARTDPAALKAFRDDFAAALAAADKAGRGDQFIPLFAGAKDLTAVRAYPPAEFFARFMKAAAAAVPAAAPGKAEVLGAVAEGRDRAHVVVRVARKPAGGEKGVVEVVSVRKVDGEWKAGVPKELAAVAASLGVVGGVDTQKAVDVIPPDPPKKK